MSIIVKNYSKTKVYSINQYLNTKIKDFKLKLAKDFELNIDNIKLEHYNRVLEDDKIMDDYIMEENSNSDNNNFIVIINSNEYDIGKMNKYLLFGIFLMLSMS